jgi:hypothetical protein
MLATIAATATVMTIVISSSHWAYISIPFCLLAINVLRLSMSSGREAWKFRRVEACQIPRRVFEPYLLLRLWWGASEFSGRCGSRALCGLAPSDFLVPERIIVGAGPLNGTLRRLLLWVLLKTLLSSSCLSSLRSSVELLDNCYKSKRAQKEIGSASEVTTRKAKDQLSYMLSSLQSPDKK